MEMEEPHVQANDTFGKLIGIQAALLAMVLSVFSIMAHQGNTESIILVNQTSDQWAHYQAKRIRDSQLELNIQLLQVLAPNNAQASQTIAGYKKEQGKYKKDMAGIKAQADEMAAEGEFTHRRTSYFELAEGLLEIAVILSSLYFLSHKKIFPILGLFLGICGAIIGASGLMLHP